MIRSAQLRSLLTALSLLASTLPALAGALPEGANLLWEDATVLAAVDDHKRLDVGELSGTFALRPSKDGELRYAARTLDNQRDPVELALWSDGRSLYLRPIDAAADQRVLVEIAVSPELEVRLDLNDSILRGGGRDGDLILRGQGLDVDLRNMSGALELELETSEILIDGAASVVLEGSSIEGSIANVAEEVELTLASSTIAVRRVEAIVADVEQTSLLVEGVEQPCTIDARDSGLAVGGLKQGGRLQLSGTPATLADSEGDLEVETDDGFEFRGLKGALGLLHVGSESKIVGNDSSGAVTIEMQVGHIGLTKITGDVQIQGIELTTKFEGLGGDLTIVAEASQIDASNVEGKMVIHNSLGDVRVSGSKKPVEIVSSGGTVRAEQIGGSLSIWGDGELIEAEWATIAVDTRGHLENSSGGVVARIPSSAKCKVEAETSYGQIESSVPGLEPEGDGSRLNGSLARGQGGSITIKAAGDVRLSHRGG